MATKYLDSYEQAFRAQLQAAQETKDFDAFVKWARDKHYQSFLAGKKAAQTPRADS